jgi:hypothetical protein
LSPSSGLHGREASVPSLPSRCLLVKHQLRILNRAASVLPTCAPQSVSLSEYKVTEVGG